ncbi:MAG TPA: choice-of-anchor P family protein [Ktedonobacteraceae bacterium]|nr:choice-of-anchor P family protein [Ktedonobacteraceae bacterium]
MRRRLIIFFTLSCVVGAGFWSVIYTQRVAQASTISTLLSGSAYGLAVSAGDGSVQFSSGPFGEVSTICTPYPANQHTTLAGLALFHGLLHSSSIQDKLTFVRSDENSSVEASSTIEHLTLGPSLLKPLLEIDGLHALARSRAHIGSAMSDTGSSSFGSIKIAGLRLPLYVAPNTRLTVPGLGSLVLNEQIEFHTSPVNTYAEVNMVDITLGLGNLLRQPAGTRIIIGHSVSSDTIVSVLAAMQGHAYGLSAELGVGKLARVKLGPLPSTEIGCLGGTNQASAVDLSIAGLIDSGIADTSTTGVVDEAHSKVEVISKERIANLSLLGGLIRVDLLQAYAHALYQGNTQKGEGGFAALQISIGKLRLLPHTYAPNMRVNLPGLGYVMIDEIVPKTTSIGYAINALDIHVTTRNKWHLAVGLRILVGHVDAGITLFH